MTIKAIYGDEPKREGEYPTCYMVGFPLGPQPITRIERREENFGDYGIAWFDVFKGEHLIASANARHVAFVDYFEPGSVKPTGHGIFGLALSLVQDLDAAGWPVGFESDAHQSFIRLRDALDVHDRKPA